MKKILLLAVLLLVAASQMQAKGDKEEVKIVLVKEENSDNYYYEGVVPVEGISKEEMFKRAKEWVLSNLKTGDNNAQFNEQELVIYNNPTISVKVKGFPDGYANFKIKISFKDGRYKFIFDNVIVIYDSKTKPYTDADVMFYGYGRTSQKLVKGINQSFAQISADLENAIKGNTAKKDDW